MSSHRLPALPGALPDAQPRLHEGPSAVVAVASRLGAQDGLNVSNELGRVRHHGLIFIGGLADLIIEEGGRVEGEKNKTLSPVSLTLTAVHRFVSSVVSPVSSSSRMRELLNVIIVRRDGLT